MKKIIALFGITLLTLTSCSTENELPVVNSAPEAVLLVKRIVSDDVSKITYDGSKIVKVEKSGFTAIYTYTGDVITKIVVTEGYKTNITEYIYEKGKLKTALEKTNNGINTTFVNTFKKEYFYDTEGMVIIKEYYYSEEIPTMYGTCKITVKKGNIVREEYFDSFGVVTEVSVYEYDTEENPVSNTLGFDKLVDPNLSSKNNIIKSISTVISGGDTSVFITTNIFTLNSEGYPLSIQSKKVFFDSLGKSKTDEDTTLYEY